MKSFLTKVYVIAAGFALVGSFLPATADAGPGGFLHKEREDVYAVHGENLNAVAGAEIEVTYDPDSLTCERVDRGEVVPSGSGTQYNANWKEPGVVRIVLVAVGQTMPEKGVLARLFFKVQRKSPPMPVLSYNAIRKDMSPDPPAAGVPVGDPEVSSATPPIAGTSGGYRRSAESEEGVEDQPVFEEPLQPEPEMEEEPPSIYTRPPARPSEPPRPTPPVRQEPAVVGTTVLERFRTFMGSRNISDLLGLFNVQVAPNVKQEPAIAISDGVSVVTITAKLATKENTTPTFALSGARLSSLRRADDGSWILQVIPTAGRLTSVVSALVEPGVVDIPLTVAPVLPAEILKEYPLTGDGFQRFVNDASIKADVNGDGKRDYIDDFIYSANYLADRQKPAKNESDGG